MVLEEDQDIGDKLKAAYGGNWFKSGVPKVVWDDSNKLANDKNYKAETKEDEVDPWDCLNIIDYRKIAVWGRNWSEIFERYYTKPGEEQLRGGKDTKTSWLQKLERIRNENFHTYSVKEEEYDFLCQLNEWLIESRVRNELE